MEYKKPNTAVDAIIEHNGGIILIKRGKEPFLGKWALPGGHVDYGESLEHAVVREVLEETSLTLKDYSQFKAYSDTDRDPRGHYITMVFIGTGYGKLMSGDDACDAKIFSLDNLPELAFDHAQILADYVKMRRK